MTKGDRKSILVKPLTGTSTQVSAAFFDNEVDILDIVTDIYEERSGGKRIMTETFVIELNEVGNLCYMELLWLWSQGHEYHDTSIQIPKEISYSVSVSFSAEFEYVDDVEGVKPYWECNWTQEGGIGEKYYYNRADNWLFISFSDTEIFKNIRIATNIICGIDSEYRLVALWVSGIQQDFAAIKERKWTGTSFKRVTDEHYMKLVTEVTQHFGNITRQIVQGTHDLASRDVLLFGGTTAKPHILAHYLNESRDGLKFFCTMNGTNNKIDVMTEAELIDLCGEPLAFFRPVPKAPVTPAVDATVLNLDEAAAALVPRDFPTLAAARSYLQRNFPDAKQFVVATGGIGAGLQIYGGDPVFNEIILMECAVTDVAQTATDPVRILAAANRIRNTVASAGQHNRLVTVVISENSQASRFPRRLVQIIASLRRANPQQWVGFASLRGTTIWWVDSSTGEVLAKAGIGCGFHPGMVLE